MKRRIAPLLIVFAVIFMPATLFAETFFGSHVEGLYRNFFTANSTGSNIRDTAGIAFDPTHWDSNGDYDQIFLANHEDSTAKSRRGIHVVDVFNSTEAVRVARTGTNNPFGVIVDPLGDLRTHYGYDNGANNTNSPSVRKTLNPIFGSEVDTRMINGSGANTLNDPISIAFVPTGFGGSYNAGEDIILFDQAYDSFNNESIVVVDKLSVSTSPISSVIYSDGSGSSNSNFRGDASNFDGYAYFARLDISTASLGGTTRPYIERVKGDGVLQRMFLDVPANLMSQTLGNAIKINQTDGSVWLPVNDSGDKKFYRVDVANAATQGGNDFLAGISEEITLTGSDAYSIGTNSMAFSPDGKFLAVGTAAGRDAMHVYHLEVEEVLFVVSINTATGEIVLRNDTSQLIDFASYTITSPMNALDVSTWNSLSNQSGIHSLVNPTDGPDPDLVAGSSSGESWEESNGSSASTIGELFLFGSTVLAPGESISLGNSYDIAIPDNDIAFEFLDANLGNLTLSQGVVEFISESGDFDNDGDVDGSDFLTWQTGFGSGSTLSEGDANGDGQVNAADFAIWESQHGTMNGSVSVSGALSGSTVPEPNTLVLLLMAALAVTGGRRR